MNYYLGFDGGGTKTEAVLMDDAGLVAGQAVAGPGNPLRVGFEAAFDALTDSATAALANAKLDKRHIRAVCAGLAGAGRPNVARRMTSFLLENFPNSIAHVTTDFEVALEAAAGSGPGVVLIAGTGSAAFGRNAVGQTARAGGYGPWIGDEGSAFEIGRRAVGAVARMRDHAGVSTQLASVIPVELKLSSWDEITERIAKNADDVFPKIFPLVIQAAEEEDSAAREILFTSAIGLSNIAMTVVRRLELADKEFILAKCGGVFGRSRLLDAILDSALRNGAPRAKIDLLGVSAAVGAARLAQRLGNSSSRPAYADGSSPRKE